MAGPTTIAELDRSPLSDAEIHEVASAVNSLVDAVDPVDGAIQQSASVSDGRTAASEDDGEAAWRVIEAECRRAFAPALDALLLPRMSDAVECVWVSDTFNPRRRFVDGPTRARWQAVWKIQLAKVRECARMAVSVADREFRTLVETRPAALPFLSREQYGMRLRRVSEPMYERFRQQLEAGAVSLIPSIVADPGPQLTAVTDDGWFLARIHDMPAARIPREAQVFLGLALVESVVNAMVVLECLWPDEAQRVLTDANRIVDEHLLR